VASDGADGTGLCVASCCTACCVTEALLPVFVEITAINRQLSMNAAARTVVALARKLAAPRPPNTVEVKPPPAMPASEPPFELCSRMDTTSSTEMIICNAIRIPYSMTLLRWVESA